MSCYSDHDEDIRTKGSCDYCGGTALEGDSRRSSAKRPGPCSMPAFAENGGRGVDLAERAKSTAPRADLEQIGYLCIQGYPARICSGCTSACCEPVFAYPEREQS